MIWIYFVPILMIDFWSVWDNASCVSFQETKSFFCRNGGNLIGSFSSNQRITKFRTFLQQRCTFSNTLLLQHIFTRMLPVAIVLRDCSATRLTDRLSISDRLYLSRFALSTQSPGEKSSGLDIFGKLCNIHLHKIHPFPSRWLYNFRYRVHVSSVMIIFSIFISKNFTQKNYKTRAE